MQNSTEFKEEEQSTPNLIITVAPVKGGAMSLEEENEPKRSAEALKEKTIENVKG